MSDLYDTDAVTWAEQQASLLRRIAAGERVNDQVDWENVVEEIEDVGGRERDKVTEALMQAMRHKLCLLGWPHSAAVRHWEAEVRIHLATARRRYRNSMRQYIDAGELAGGLSERAARDRQPYGGRVAAVGSSTERLPLDAGRVARRGRGSAALEARSDERPHRHDRGAAGGLLLGDPRPEPAGDRLLGAR